MLHVLIHHVCPLVRALHNYFHLHHGPTFRYL